MCETPWEFGKTGNFRYHVLENLDARENGSRRFYEAVIDFFENEKVEILEVVWIPGYWRIMVPTGEDISTLPGKICRTTAFYLLGDGPAAAAALQLQPFDESEYSPIRPGVMVAPDRGVLVKNSQNDASMTVTSHCFPNDDLKVHHPQAHISPIGEVAPRIGDTDIALAKLWDNIPFESRTSQSELDTGGVVLRRVKDPFRMKCFDKISMHNPCGGSIDGLFVAVSMNRMPTDAQGKNLWQWFGKDVGGLPVEGVVPNNGSGGLILKTWSAQELVRNGYTLCNT